MVLATALATRTTWFEPFRIVPADLGGAWAGRRESHLSASSAHEAHQMLLASTEQAGDAVARLCTVSDRPLAVQEARAAFDTEGFEAGVITAFGMMRGIPRRQRIKVRHAHLRFDRPYAVVAVATSHIDSDRVWSGVPVYNAWVAEPVEPTPVSEDMLFKLRAGSDAVRLPPEVLRGLR